MSPEIPNQPESEDEGAMESQKGFPSDQEAWEEEAHRMPSFEELEDTVASSDPETT